MIPAAEIRDNYGSEIALVLLCCRVHFKTETQAALQHFIDTNDIDWVHFFHLAGYHRIEPVAFSILAKTDLPPEISARIKEKQFALIRRNFTQALETEQIITLLAQHGVRCVPYKGVAFSRQLYGDITSRESSDIDLIIRPEDFEKVMALMKEQGYLFEHQVEYDYYKDEVFKRKNSLSFNKYQVGKRLFHIEFHWRVTENIVRTNKNADMLLFSGSYKTNLATQEVEVLNIPSHYTAVFIHHSGHDGFGVLRNLVDLCQVSFVKEAVIEFKEIENLLMKLHLKKASHACAELSGALLGVKIPCLPSGEMMVSKGTKNFLLLQLIDEKKMGAQFKRKLIRKNILTLKDTTSEKCRYLLACLQLRFVPATKDIRVFKLPRNLHFLYFFLKPFRSLFSRVNIDEEKQIASRQSPEERQ